jgi:hypothetical protein
MLANTISNKQIINIYDLHKNEIKKINWIYNPNEGRLYNKNFEIQSIEYIINKYDIV